MGASPKAWGRRQKRGGVAKAWGRRQSVGSVCTPLSLARSVWAMARVLIRERTARRFDDSPRRRRRRHGGGRRPRRWQRRRRWHGVRRRCSSRSSVCSASAKERDPRASPSRARNVACCQPRTRSSEAADGQTPALHPQKPPVAARRWQALDCAHRRTASVHPLLCAWQ